MGLINPQAPRPPTGVASFLCLWAPSIYMIPSWRPDVCVCVSTQIIHICIYIYTYICIHMHMHTYVQRAFFGLFGAPGMILSNAGGYDRSCSSSKIPRLPGGFLQNRTPPPQFWTPLLLWCRLWSPGVDLIEARRKPQSSCTVRL